VQELLAPTAKVVGVHVRKVEDPTMNTVDVSVKVRVCWTVVVPVSVV
jgi:hypothetical protein